MKCCTNYNQETPGVRRPPGRGLPQAPTEPKKTLGRTPVVYRHLENRRTTRLGNPGTPLYKKGDWANPDKWRPIVCATTEAKLI